MITLLLWLLMLVMVAGLLWWSLAQAAAEMQAEAAAADAAAARGARGPIGAPLDERAAGKDAPAWPVNVLPVTGEPAPPLPPLDVVARRLDASIEWMLRGRVTGECIGVADMLALRELLRQREQRQQGAGEGT